MPKIDLTKLSLSELKDIQEKLPGAIAAKEDGARQDFLEFVRKEAEKRGIDHRTVMSSGSGRRKSGPVKPKYRHPKKPSLTWTGRGRMPLWMGDLLKGGKKKEDFLIK